MDLQACVDPELRPALDALAAMPPIDWDDLPATRAQRAATYATQAANLSDLPGIAKEDRTVPGPPGAPEVPIRLYRPAAPTGTLPGLLWIHGGGMVLGSVEQNDQLAQHFAVAGGCLVASVEYRLAPEHPFPAPPEDCYAALRWFHAQAGDLGLDPTRIAIGGASAGGGLAAGLALLARDRGEVPVAFQFLIYPMIDDRNDTPASHSIVDPRVWSRDKNLHGWRAYLGTAPGSADVSPYAAPARATDLAGLPAAFIMVGTVDLFVDEDIAYAQRLIGAGVPTELHVYPGAFHGSENLVPAATLSRRMAAERDAALERGLRARS